MYPGPANPSVAQPYNTQQNFARGYSNELTGSQHDHSHVAYQQENIMNRSTHLEKHRASEPLSDLNQNTSDLSTSSSFSSADYMDISHSYLSKSPTEAMVVDENSHSISSKLNTRVEKVHNANRGRIQAPLSHSRPALSGQIKITDVQSNSPTHENPTTSSSATESSSGTKDLSKNYVYQILMRSHKGKIELAKQKYLEDKMKDRDSADALHAQNTANNAVNEMFIDKLNRARICDLVMDYEVDHHGFEPTKARYHFLGDSLIEVFIYEDKSARIGGTDEGVVKGRLPNKLKKLRPEATEWGFWKSPYSRKNKSKGTEALSLECLQYFLNKTNVDTEFLQKWAEFIDERIQFFQSSSIAAIAVNIPAIVTASGYELLVSDFILSYTTHENFEKKWPKLAHILVKVAKTIVKNATTRYKKALEQLLDYHKSAKDQEYIQNLATLLLAHLLGSVVCVVKKEISGEKSWRATSAEAQESFIVHVEKVTEGEPEVEARTSKLKKLFAKHNLPLSPYVVACGKLGALTHCYVILDGFKYRFQGPNCLIKSIDLLTELKDEVGHDTIGKIFLVLDNNTAPFSCLLIEKQRFSMYEKKSVHQPPKDFKIVEKYINAGLKEKIKKNVCGVHISLPETLIIFLQIPGIFHCMMKYTKQLLQETNTISNIIQARLWQMKFLPALKEKIVFPLLVFFDDCEMRNPLGSHSGEQKFGAVYISLPCLPPHLSSRFTNILISTIFHTKDRDDYGNMACFEPLLRDLEYLSETGIIVTIDGVMTRVYFECVLFVEREELGLSQRIRTRQSAAEMVCLSRYLVLMIEDLIPKNDEYWMLYRILRKIIGIVIAPHFIRTDIFTLRDHIKNHHKLYMKLFGCLKPKFHFMIHLPRIMMENGPLIHFWSMTFGRKHSDLKEVAEGTTSSRNLPKTIAIRNSLRLCYLKEFTDSPNEEFRLGTVMMGEVSSLELRTKFPGFETESTGKMYRDIEFIGKIIPMVQFFS
ncbi:hypothetical protein QAD02_000486 [Eretmocerus hayati]|uniref:Uncharacterized protein n=1 Tax=Eretmocerus hayati TaxID=131215 RepID=A0ACC2NDJ2_9HYME|nr:hypothetical protein QAD02_000486 [Eretmocerus hayati]